jgi:hypothetical protein
MNLTVFSFNRLDPSPKNLKIFSPSRHETALWKGAGEDRGLSSQTRSASHIPRNVPTISISRATGNEAENAKLIPVLVSTSG